MKKVVLFLLLLIAPSWLNAEIVEDSIVMTVAGKNVTLDEFLFMAGKNKEVNMADRKSVKNYVDLYKNFKLKVAEAESLGIDSVASFKSELENYRTQLELGFLSDRVGQEKIAQAVYDRSGEALELEHIVFRLPKKSLAKDTLAVYQKADALYQKLISEKSDFKSVGTQLMMLSGGKVVYEKVHSVVPMRTFKAFEDAAYNLPVGEISKPVRTAVGFHLIKVNKRKPNNTVVKAAHILLPDTASDVASLLKEVEDKARSGEDFGQLAKSYSIDKASAVHGGELSTFGLGQMIPEFEEVAFAMKNPGDISQPVKSRFGYHIIKLLDKQPKPSFISIQQDLENKLAHSEWNFDYNRTFDEKLKKEYNFVFYSDAYAELKALSNDYFPTDPSFAEEAKEMKKPLFKIQNRIVSQVDFVKYMQVCPFSAKTFAGDFMQEVLDLYVRALLTDLEKKNLQQKHPEFNLLMNEYRDGILLFNISSNKIWNQPVEEQKKLEKDWLKELNKKYPVKINWRLIKSIKE